jgi:hypothetical protein
LEKVPLNEIQGCLIHAGERASLSIQAKVTRHSGDLVMTRIKEKEYLASAQIPCHVGSSLCAASSDI